jgi:hypothetical protein
LSSHERLLPWEAGPFGVRPSSRRRECAAPLAARALGLDPALEAIESAATRSAWEAKISSVAAAARRMRAAASEMTARRKCADVRLRRYYNPLEEF